jgi:hypothetical protein
MRYSVYQKIVFPNEVNIPPVDYLGMVLDDCRRRLRAEGVGALNANIQIRPWPRDVTESSSNGYDRLVPRHGFDIVMTSDTGAV